MSVLQSEFPEKITDKNSLITQVKQIIRDKSEKMLNLPTIKNQIQ